MCINFSCGIMMCHFLHCKTYRNAWQNNPCQDIDRVAGCRVWRQLCRILLPLLLTSVLLFTCVTISSAKEIQVVGLLVGSGGLGDQSFNDMTLAGLGRAQKKYTFKLVVQETAGTPESNEKSLLAIIEQGADIIVVNGSEIAQLIPEYSSNYPQKYFLVNDYPIDNLPNVASTVFAQQEGAYLVGLLAAHLTTTGHIGFIGGVDLPVIQSFKDGYIQGAQSVSSDVKVSAVLVSPAGDYSGFNSPTRGYELAVAMYEQGVDILFSVAGLTGNGIIQAALQQRKLVIGVDADQDHMAKGFVLTSMMKRLDLSTFSEISKIFEGRFESGIMHYSLENGGVGLTEMRYTRHLVDDSVMQQLQQATQDIIDGRIIIQGTVQQ